MVKQNHIVIIGGTACGPRAAARARRSEYSTGPGFKNVRFMDGSLNAWPYDILKVVP